MNTLEPLDWVRRLNYCGSGVGGAAQLVSLDATQMMEAACESTGLGDFGAGDWEETYRRLVDSLQREAQLHTLGRLLMRTDLLRALRNRLLMQEQRRRHPQIDAERIVEPLFIVGQGRTGSSILFELLALDPRHRAPLAWEAASPVAPAAPMFGAGGSREHLAETVNEFFADIRPEIRAAHEHRWDLPVECPRFMEPDFSSDWWAMLCTPMAYLLWKAEQKPDSAYDWHKRVLQTLQHGAAPGRRWLLKSPAHVRYLDQIMQRYPDARFIFTHRDPLKTVTSTASLMCAMRSTRTDDVNPMLAGQMINMSYAAGTRKAMQERASGVVPAAQIVDIHFRELMQDPVAAIARAYAALGLPFDDEFAAGIRDYLERKPRGKFGEHRYEAAEFGLDANALRDEYRFYTDHYGVELES